MLVHFCVGVFQTIGLAHIFVWGVHYIIPIIKFVYQFICEIF